jgi:hypothetical protein
MAKRTDAWEWQTRPRRGVHRSEQLMAFIYLGSRIAYRIAIVLGLLEIAAWFGDPTTTGHILDGIALVATTTVILASTVGVRSLLEWLQRAKGPGDTPW